MQLLDLFLQLQALDTEMFQLYDSKERLPLKLEKSKKKLEEEEKKLTQCEESLKKIKVRMMDEEGSMASLESGIQKKRIQLNQIKTNKEYAALVQEIENNQKQKGIIEENILRLMEESDHIQARKEEQQKKVAEMETEYKQCELDVQKTLEEIKKKLKEISIQQQEKCKNIQRLDDKTLKAYQRLINSNNRNGIVPVEDGSCGFCHIELRPNELAALSPGKIVFCKDCTRLLYLPNHDV